MIFPCSWQSGKKSGKIVSCMCDGRIHELKNTRKHFIFNAGLFKDPYAFGSPTFTPGPRG